MLGLAALMLAAATPNTSPSLSPAEPWWERITFTVADKGSPQGCLYESSFGAPENCADEDPGTAQIRNASAPGNGSYTKISIERRFTPESEPARVELAAGDTFLGGQIIALAIDSSGTVQQCKVVGSSGELSSPYGCEEARAERFKASATRDRSELRQGYMTVLVYGYEGRLT